MVPDAASATVRMMLLGQQQQQQQPQQQQHQRQPQHQPTQQPQQQWRQQQQQQSAPAAPSAPSALSAPLPLIPTPTQRPDLMADTSEESEPNPPATRRDTRASTSKKAVKKDEGITKATTKTRREQEPSVTLSGSANSARELPTISKNRTTVRSCKCK